MVRKKTSNSNRVTTKEAVRMALEIGSAVCLRGETGVGKTDMVKQIGEETGRKVTILNTAIQSVEDLIGFPYRKGGKMYWAQPAWFPQEDGTKHILFLDELNRANKEVINALMPLLLDGTLHLSHVPNDTWIIAAINPDSENYDMVNGFGDSAIWNRMTIINVFSDSDDWGVWLKEHNMVNSDNRELIDTFKNRLAKTAEKYDSSIVQQPSNRSYAMALKTVQYAIEKRNIGTPYSVGALEKVLMGILGTGAYADMKEVLMRTYDATSIPSVEDLVKDVTSDNIVGKCNYLKAHLTAKTPVTAEQYELILNFAIKYKKIYKDQIDDLKKVFYGLNDRDDYEEILDNDKIQELRNALSQ